MDEILEDYDKPAVEALVDLINRSNGTFFRPEEMEFIAISPETRDFDYKSIPLMPRYKAAARMRWSATKEEASFNYLRLLLPAYLYRGLFDNVVLPSIFSDRYVTTVETFASDALAYLRSEYKVWLTEEDCRISIDPSAHLGATSAVVHLEMRRDHPVWVGAIVLEAQLATP